MPSVPTAKLIASVVVRDGDRALIFFEKGDDGILKYNLPGGHVEIGETPVEAALREVREEAGVGVELTSFLQVTVNAWEKHHSVLVYFEANAPRDAELKTESGISTTWMTSAEVAALPDTQCVFGVKQSVARSFAGSTIPSDTLLLRKDGNPVAWSE